MSDHKDPKLNSAGDDLIDVKALIRDAAPASCTLEDILAEYGATPKPAPRPTRPGGGKVVAFPGTAVLPPPEEEEPRNESPEESPPGEEPEPEEEQTSPPGERSAPPLAPAPPPGGIPPGTRSGVPPLPAAGGRRFRGRPPPCPLPGGWAGGRAWE